MAVFQARQQRLIGQTDGTNRIRPPNLEDRAQHRWMQMQVMMRVDVIETEPRDAKTLKLRLDLGL
jgi:hypothetical protein